MVREVLLGRVANVLPTGGLLVKAPGPLPVHASRGGKSGFTIGTGVTDGRQKPVGRVSDVIGPTQNPYVLVTPARGAPLHRVLGKEVYASDLHAPRRRPSHKGGGPRRR